MLDKTE